MRVLGLDSGIASIGWALIEIEDGNSGRPACGKIIDAGTWMFDAPEEQGQNGMKLKSELRRAFRGQRRVIRRRRQRMNEVRRILHRHGLLDSAGRDALKQPGLDPWRLRAEGLDRLLTPTEFAVALGHIACHRGFKSNSKGAKSANAADETSKMKKEMEGAREKLARYEGSPARMMTEDDDFVLRATKMNGAREAENNSQKQWDIVRRFRNREGDYSRSLLRDDLAAEVRALFSAQARLQSGFATKELEAEFTEAAFFQRELQDSEKLVGSCPFEPSEKRSPKRGYSFEFFRFLARLNHLTLREGRDERTLTPDEVRAAAAHFGAKAKFTYAALRKKLALPDTASFTGVKKEEEGKLDVVARSGEVAAGTARLRRVIVEALGELAWGSLVNAPERLDRIAEIITFRNDLGRIRGGLNEAGFDPSLTETIVKACGDGALDAFTGAGHISAKAARNIIPGLLQGLTYDKACAQAGYDHTASSERQAFDVKVHGKEALARILSQQRISRDLVGSPTARKALIEAVKQVKAIIEKYGVPDRIHIELARDVGKSIEERREIQSGIENRNKQKDKLREQFAKDVGHPPQDGDRGKEELLRYELWREQNGRCLYTDACINPRQLAASDNSVQVDHILPWSRFGDDSFLNKTLCTAKANQDKKGRTPFEWFKADKTEAEWDAFVARVESIQYMKGLKKRNYKLKNAEEAAEKFRNRNLNDTRWTCRLLAEALKQLYPKGEKDENGKERRRVFARPGALTDRLRRAWGLQRVKKNEKGKRIRDDRHHALDAIVVAATSEPLLQRATREVQEIERKGLHYDLTKNITPPWPDFRQQALEAVEKVFVARAERRRARGKAHDATIRHIAMRDGGQKVYERKKIADLELNDLERVKDADRNAALIDSLRKWIEAGKPKDSPPLSPKGDPVSKVRLETAKAKCADLVIRGGQVDRDGMIRVDVFSKIGTKGDPLFRLVPIYRDQIATMDMPPVRAVTRGKAVCDWELMDGSWTFLWSLNPFCYVHLIDENGEPREGYFRSLDISDAIIRVSAHHDSSQLLPKIGTRKLKSFKKLAVNRFGLVYDSDGVVVEVPRELRTWRGKVCT